MHTYIPLCKLKSDKVLPSILLIVIITYSAILLILKYEDNPQKMKIVKAPINKNESSNGKIMTNTLIKSLKMDKEDVFVGYYDYPLEYINTLEHKCSNGKRQEIVFLINTYIKNVDRRNAIRQTWGSEVREKYKIKRLFLMGIDYNNDGVLNETLVENKEHNDILIGNIHDTYHNNSLKCMMALRWSKQFCNNSIFYIIADDDAYINIKNLVNYLRQYVRNTAINKYPTMFLPDTLPQLKFFGGFVFEQAFPNRDGQFTLTEAYFPYEDYPPFVNGHCMIFSNDVLEIFIEAAKHVKLIWLDDVYFGFLAAWANLNVQEVPGIDILYPDNIYFARGDPDINYFDKILSSHYVPTDDLITIWKEQMRSGTA